MISDIEEVAELEWHLTVDRDKILPFLKNPPDLPDQVAVVARVDALERIEPRLRNVSRDGVEYIERFSLSGTALDLMQVGESYLGRKWPRR